MAFSVIVFFDIPYSSQISCIKRIFEKAELQGIPLWLESGWAIDARLGQVSRQHADIDIAYPDRQKELFLNILEHEGFENYKEIDYGFLMSKEDILIDAEPCFLQMERLARNTKLKQCLK